MAPLILLTEQEELELKIQLARKTLSLLWLVLDSANSQLLPIS